MSHGLALVLAVAASCAAQPLQWRLAALPARSGHAMAYDSARQASWSSEGVAWMAIPGSGMEMPGRYGPAAVRTPETARRWPTMSLAAVSYSSAGSRKASAPLATHGSGTGRPGRFARRPDRAHVTRTISSTTAGAVASFSSAANPTAFSTARPGNGTVTRGRFAPPPAPNRAADRPWPYDEARACVVLFGGMVPWECVGDTWEWDGNEWTHRSTIGPNPRHFHAMAYESSRQRVVLFGG